MVFKVVEGEERTCLFEPLLLAPPTFLSPFARGCKGPLLFSSGHNRHT